MSVSARVEEISEDVAVERQERFCTNLQSIVWNCAALAKQWRSVIEYVSTRANCGNHIDYRGIGEILIPAAEKTLSSYSEVEAMIKGSPCSIRDAGDLTLAIIEAGNVIKWLNSWPTHDDSRRNAARESFDRGEMCSGDLVE